MTPFSLYTGTGQVVSAGHVPDINLVDVPDGCRMLKGVYAEPGFSYVAHGKAHPIPEAPGPHYEFNYATRQWELDVERVAVHVRATRDRLLNETDWVVLRAYDRGEQVPEEWLNYRQALRDIASQPGFPTEVVWPEAPTG